MSCMKMSMIFKRLTRLEISLQNNDTYWEFSSIFAASQPKIKAGLWRSIQNPSNSIEKPFELNIESVLKNVDALGVVIIEWPTRMPKMQSAL